MRAREVSDKGTASHCVQISEKSATDALVMAIQMFGEERMNRTRKVQTAESEKKREM
jgi:hypothetical protein